ncbi:MAG TPA: histidinol-phosphate transaminase [Actinomycetes bacterium]|nr:histidinol-phosphate transaminase [Actinomycetes bacterium]
MNGPRLRSALDGVPGYRAGKQAPTGAFKLSSNENPFPPLPGVLAAVEDAAATLNRYPDFGSARLIAALAARHRVPEESIALGTGSVAVLAETMQAMAGEGDEVVIPWRSFEAYPILVQLSGATLVKVPLDEHHALDLDAMAKAVTDRTRLVMVCSPNNPTGSIVDRQSLLTFLERVGPDVLVAIDEAYIEFTDEYATDGAVDLVGGRGNVMVLRTFSKAFGLAGLRVGYAVAPPTLAAGLRKAQLPFGVTTVAEQAALASLAAERQLVARVAALVLERDRVTHKLRRLGLSFPEPHGNFVWLALGRDAEELARRCEAHGVVVRLFNDEGVRVTVGEAAANDRFLSVVEDFA